MYRVAVALCFLSVLSCALGCTYTVVAGDTLYDIAARYGTFSAQDLCNLNNLQANCGNIQVGQVLQLPNCPSGGTGSSGCPSTYTVQSGDTLGAIASRYGLDANSICSYNGLSNCDQIQVGQVLKLPCSGSGSSSSSSSSSSTGSNPPPSGSWPNGPIKAMYNINSVNSGDFQQMADAGYNLILLAFHVSGQPKYAAQKWQSFGSGTQQSVVNYIHSKGARIVVSAGGAEDVPYSSFSGTQYGTNVANFAKANNLDGVDFDMENIGGNFLLPGKSFSDSVQWFVDATNAARNILGPNAIITHAPQTPYFGANHGWADGYGQIYKKATTINAFLIQFYNNDGGCTTYESIFTSNNGGSIKEIYNGGVPLSKLVVGKPVANGDGNGIVDPSTLHSFFTRAQSEFGWYGGIMGWAWHDINTNSNWVHTILP